jgi:hypothetical protein
MKYIKLISFTIAFFLPMTSEASETAEKSLYFSIIGICGASNTTNFEDWKFERAAQYYSETKALSQYSDAKPSPSAKNESNTVWGIKYDAAFFRGNIGCGISAIRNFTALNYGENSDYEIKNGGGQKIAGVSGSPDFLIVSPSFYYMFELEPSRTGGRRFLRLGAGPDFVKISYSLAIRKYGHEDLPETSPYERSYTAKTLGWHINFAYILNYDYWAITGEINYSKAHAVEFTDEKSGDVMRFSDGRKVKTTLTCFSFNIGAGVRISWK